MPDSEPINHHATGVPIAQSPEEQLQRIAWLGPVLVTTRPGLLVSCCIAWPGPTAKRGTRPLGCPVLSPQGRGARLIQSFTMGSGMAGAWPSPAMP